MVYFDLFGKLIKVRVRSTSSDTAKQYVKDMIKFNKVTELPKDDMSDIEDMFDQINSILR